ncbi:secretion protein HlyD family protein [Pseudodesulfovibrio mercurii]|uniref:Secretion protein HlyD family protein n=1 Tax=Pseudodesulfovibrio mercurii TaxID=641491 RepID=F0JCC5_9BACT|nr:efflux RND transporter periplasmic adaptor subunit [Pseudodesulfovibrio mercurii]EGB14423.1 secretion protein HlyD family protein [Pseudodesulfovibrio mercurii]
MRIVLLLLAITIGAAVYVVHESPQWLSASLPDVGSSTEDMAATPPISNRSPWVAAYGRVEPATEERDLAFEISGVIESVVVEEDEHITRGQPLAYLRDDQYVAHLATAKANAQAKKAYYDKLVAGARKEEKSEAQSVVQRTKSVMINARNEMNRRMELLDKKLIAKEEVDRATKDFLVAEKQYEEAVQRMLITENQSRKEDILMAWAEYQAAVQGAMEAEAQLDQTVLRSPIDGIVLRRHRLPGEHVSVFVETPVMTVADVSKFNVRAELDKKFVTLVHAGQDAYFTSEAFGDERIRGKVLRKAGTMQLTEIPPRTPGEKVDKTVLEVIIALEPREGMVTGLTGDVFIQTEKTVGSEFNSIVNDKP